jgi:hypothetical protein
MTLGNMRANGARSLAVAGLQQLHPDRAGPRGEALMMRAATRG